jgi:hypothetical protein
MQIFKIFVCLKQVLVIKFVLEEHMLWGGCTKSFSVFLSVYLLAVCLLAWWKICSWYIGLLYVYCNEIFRLGWLVFRK